MYAVDSLVHIRPEYAHLWPAKAQHDLAVNGH